MEDILASLNIDDDNYYFLYYMSLCKVCCTVKNVLYIFNQAH